MRYLLLRSVNELEYVVSLMHIEYMLVQVKWESSATLTTGGASTRERVILTVHWTQANSSQE